MKALVACEESQVVTIELRNLGVEAYSCDIQDCSGGHPEWHIKGDVLPIINGRCEFTTMDGEKHTIDGKWDLLIAHPPCTDLAVNGAAWFAEKQHDMRQQKSCVFFMYFALAYCKRIAIENPVGIMSTVYRKPDQIIHPWQFGDNHEKTTCLWLKGLPKLTPEVKEKPELEYFEWRDKKTGKTKRQPKWFADAWKLSPEERARVRSKTFPGIAHAMATQWVSYIRETEGIQ